MSTRATIRFATREEGVTFNEHPKKWNAQLYRHHDGYPEGLGIDLAEQAPMRVEIEHIDTVHGDVEYIYYIWQKPNDSTWISIFEVGTNDHYCKECGHYLEPQLGEDKCIFVGLPTKLIEKYKQNTNDDG